MDDLTPTEELTVDNETTDVSDTPELRDIRIDRELSFYGERVITMTLPGESSQSGTYWNTAWFIADMNYEILEARFTYAQESSDSGTVVDIMVADDGTSVANGTRILNSNAFGFTDSLQVNNATKATLPTDRRSRLIKKGQKVGMYFFTNGVTASRSAHMTLRLKAIK